MILSNTVKSQERVSSRAQEFHSVHGSSLSGWQQDGCSSSGHPQRHGDSQGKKDKLLLESCLEASRLHRVLTDTLLCFLASLAQGTQACHG